MNGEPKNELARLIVRYANDSTAAKQLRKLPAFAVPQDSESTFQVLLERLDATVAANASNARIVGANAD